MIHQSNRWRRFSTVRAIACLLTVLFVLASQAQAGDLYQVLRVVDGDTIVIDYQGRSEKVRLLCVDTPESVHQDKKQNIPMGSVASQYTKDRLSGQYVGLEFEGDRIRGNYGRLLAYVIVGGSNFNLELVRQGLSPYYTKYGHSQKFDADFGAAEKQARDAGLGIWGDPELTQKYLRLKSKWGQAAASVERESSARSTVASGESGQFVGSRNSNKYHRPDCRWAKRIKPENLLRFGSREEAERAGYEPCGTCGP